MTDTFWKIEEYLGGGIYIVLDGIYTTREKAEAGFPKGGGGGFLARLYAAGRDGNGPVRVNTRGQTP